MSNVHDIYVLVECLALWGEHERTQHSVNVVAVYSACDKITVVVLEEACAHTHRTDSSGESLQTGLITWTLRCVIDYVYFLANHLSTDYK